MQHLIISLIYGLRNKQANRLSLSCDDSFEIIENNVYSILFSSLLPYEHPLTVYILSVMVSMFQLLWVTRFPLKHDAQTECSTSTVL